MRLNPLGHASYRAHVGIVHESRIAGRKQIVEIALTVLAIVAPVFLLGSACFVWAKAGYYYPTAFITRIAMTLAVPCLIFTALMQADIALSTLGALTLASLVAYVAVIWLSWGVVAMLRLDRAAYVAPLAFGNTGNLGLPLALFAVGETGLGLAVVVFAVMAILTFTIGLWLVAGGISPARMLREPMLWATLLGGLFLTMGWETP